MNRFILGCALVLAVTVVLATAEGSEINFGDHRSATLTTRAWEALERGEPDAALAYIARCIELYEEEAQRMQAERDAFAPPDTAATYWALNDVGTCLFIQGEVLLKQGDRAGARHAFERVVREFGFSQCWDPRGWFWKPAEAAKQKIVELEFDEE
jgi:tetratricopeptide (TPR) repeat protein